MVVVCGLLLGLVVVGQPKGLGGRYVLLVRSATMSLEEPKDVEKVMLTWLFMNKNMLFNI